MIKIVDLDFKAIEDKWRQKWADAKIFEANPDERKKWFVNSPFPYVNSCLHLGHGFTYTRMDVIARFKRMQGYNVLFPFAFHATGEPIVGVAKRIEKDDSDQIKMLTDAGVSEREIKKFKDPKYLVRYWQKRIKQDVNRLGIAVDWRRSFTTIDPEFNRFIEWQYRLLKDNGYVVQGTHPVVWCPNCKSPTGDHDRLQGGGEGPINYILFNFKLPSGEILPMGTLRPETIYGVTNVWINPDVEYVKAKVDNEIWIISESCTEKLKDQMHSVQIKGKIRGEELIGKRCINPILMNEVLILPASFVNPKSATGLVMSVPSHAPYDWIGLKDLMYNPSFLKKYGISLDEVSEIKPISVVKTEGLGEHPAVDLCEKLEVKNQNEVEKLDKATNFLYKKEFHQGILREVCGEHQGMRVSQVKEDLSKDFQKVNAATTMWELSGGVVCRCGTKCHVKILENQWFLKFSDERWKEKARLCLRRMKIYPEEARENFESTIEWLQEKACARKSGLGTRLPWDKDWIVETLSDSVIYMSYYTIANYINSEKIEPDQLNDDVFEYVFHGEGDVKKISEERGISKEILQKMRSSFEYWYGFDIRGSAKELIPNHLTFCIFHHTAVWPNEKNWPRAFAINGMLNVEGEKMSKSKGNFILLKDAIEKYGADATRIALMDSAEGLNDANWLEKDVLAWKNKLSSFYGLVKRYYDKGKLMLKRPIDAWLVSRFQNYIKMITDHLEKAENRSALTYFHQMVNDLQWYLKRSEERNKTIVNYALEVMTKVLSLYSPFISEEIWNMMDKERFISLEKWPEFDPKKIDEYVLKQEETFKNICEDIKQTIKLSKKNKDLYLYVITEKEMLYLQQASSFLKREFGFKEVKVFLVRDSKKYDPQNKSIRAKYGKPGIYLE
ncbi:MAG: leucine--tRNA ligase [Candidatus Aenigmarchaeota archaeon]|nr:leucine--tRNA ligase [Candidatus Aenigmarchaeota archaeon]